MLYLLVWNLDEYKVVTRITLKCSWGCLTKDLSRLNMCKISLRFTSCEKFLIFDEELLTACESQWNFANVTYADVAFNKFLVVVQEVSWNIL